jgi:hypothetical protein
MLVHEEYQIGKYSTDTMVTRVLILWLNVVNDGSKNGSHQIVKVGVVYSMYALKACKIDCLYGIYDAMIM